MDEALLSMYISAILIFFIIVACVVSLFLMFRYVNRVKSEGLQRQRVLEILEEVRKSELYPQIELLMMRKNELEEKKTNLKEQLNSEQDPQKREGLQAELYEIGESLEALSKKTQQTEAEIKKQAKDFAKAHVPSHVTWSDAFSPYFYLEFSTVIVTISALLILAINETVSEREAVPILAAIVGYVLGKATATTRPQSERSS